MTNFSVGHRPARRPLVQINYLPPHRAFADPYRFRKSTGTHLAIYPTARYAESPFYFFAAQKFLCLGLSHGSHPLLVSSGLPFQVRKLLQDRFLPSCSGRCAGCCHRWTLVGATAPLSRPPDRSRDTGSGLRKGGRPVHRPSACNGSACNTIGPGRQRQDPSSEKACRSRRCDPGAWLLCIRNSELLLEPTGTSDATACSLFQLEKHRNSGSLIGAAMFQT